MAATQWRWEGEGMRRPYSLSEAEEVPAPAYPIGPLILWAATREESWTHWRSAWILKGGIQSNVRGVPDSAVCHWLVLLPRCKAYLSLVPESCVVPSWYRMSMVESEERPFSRPNSRGLFRSTQRGETEVRTVCCHLLLYTQWTTEGWRRISS